MLQAEGASLTAGQGSFTIELRLVRPDRTVVWGLLHRTRAKDGKGRPRYFLEQMEDITERKRVEAALKERERFSRDVLDSLIAPTAVIDTDGVILAVNRSWDRFGRRWVGREPEDTAIVMAVLGMAQSLGLSVVAEGVETEQQLEALRGLGCERAQGFYFARPEPADIVARLLRRRSA